MFKFEFERGEMENRIVIKILRKQLDHVIIHEQVENGIAIIKNLSANQIDQQFITPRRVFQSKQKHPWIEEKPTSHITLKATLIFFCELQNGEIQRRTSNLQQSSKREKHQIENVDSQDESRWRSRKSGPWQGVTLESTSLM